MATRFELKHEMVLRRTHQLCCQHLRGVCNFYALCFFSAKFVSSRTVIIYFKSYAAFCKSSSLEGLVLFSLSFVLVVMAMILLFNKISISCAESTSRARIIFTISVVGIIKVCLVVIIGKVVIMYFSSSSYDRSLRTYSRLFPLSSWLTSIYFSLELLRHRHIWMVCPHGLSVNLILYLVKEMIGSAFGRAS